MNDFTDYTTDRLCNFYDVLAAFYVAGAAFIALVAL